MSVLERLHRDDRAQVSFLAVAAALVFIGLMAMIMNTNDILRHRIHVQEAADVTALTAATWTARGMNLVTMTNVLNSKLLTMTVLAKSLRDTFPPVLAIAEAQAAAFTACSAAPFVGVVCAVMAAVVRVQKTILKVIEKAIKPIANQSACSQSGKIFKMMRGFKTAAEGIKSSFPGIGIAESLLITQANGVNGFALQGGIITQPGQPTKGVQLPVIEGPKGTENFCKAIKTGGPGYVMEGYKSGQGPMKLGKFIWDMVFVPFFNLLPHPIFYGFHTAYMAEIGCKPGDKHDSGNNDPTRLETLGECRQYHAKHGTEATWYKYHAKTEWKDNDSINLDSYTPWKPPDAGAGDDIDPDDEKDFNDNEDRFRQACLEEFPPEECESDKSGASNYTSKFAEESSGDKGKSEPSCNGTERGYPNLGPKGDKCFSDVLDTCDRLEIERNDFKRFIDTAGGVNRGEAVGMYYMKSVDVEEKDGKFRHEVWIWTLADAGEADLSPEEQAKLVQDRAGQNPGKANTTGGCKGLVAPMLFDEASNANADNRLRQMAFTWVELNDTDGVGAPFWSSFFDDPPDRLTAYAQAQVYNELADNHYDRMFAQDWRVRLEQSNLLTQALGADAVKAANLFSVSGFVDLVNNH